MTNFKANPEAVAKLKAMFAELHELCVANNIAYVAAICTEDNDQFSALSSSAYVDSDLTPTPNAIIAAVEIIRAPDVPDELVKALRLRNIMADECDCDECRENRAAQAY